MRVLARNAERIAALLRRTPGQPYTATELSDALGGLTRAQCRSAAQHLVRSGAAQQRVSTRAAVRRRSAEYLVPAPEVTP